MPTLFPTDLPAREWVHFPASGFTAPACGVIYRLGHTVTNGLALGGIDTGCIDLETSGLWGYCTLFNTHVPRRGPLNLPFLGLGVGGRTWVLCHPQTKQGAGSYQHPTAPGGTFRMWGEEGWENRAAPLAPGLDVLNLEGVETAQEIHYWGHYPVADLEFTTSAPVGVGLRTWAPFLPGDVVGSMWPAITFAVHLRNHSEQNQQGCVALSFPGPTLQEAGADRLDREEVSGAFGGAVVRGPLAAYALGAVGEPQVRLGGELGGEGEAWARIATALPPPAPDQPGAAVAVDFALAPGQEQVVTFVLTWCAPTWKGGGYNWAPRSATYTHMYARHYPDPLAAARRLAAEGPELLRRVLAWQEVLYAEHALPVWLREGLVNVLYLLAEDSLWAQPGPGLPAWVGEDGLFGLNECPRGCPQIECIPCSFYGNLPLVYFFPELARSTLRGYQGYQSADGAPPWIFGGCTGNTAPIDFASPTRGYQFATNGISLVDMVDRLVRCAGDAGGADRREFYPMVKRCTEWTMALRTTAAYTEGQRVIAMPDPDSDETMKPPTEWFEAREPGWAGMTAHVGGLHLAQLHLARRLAEEAGDAVFAQRCARWLAAGAQAMEEHLWTGAYYLNYLDPESGRRSDFVFGYQLDGEWILAHHGLPPALPPRRIVQVLDTLQRTNVALTRYGAVNYANPDGTPIRQAAEGTWDYGTYSYFPPEALMLAMTYMYYGQREFGAELARRVWHNITCQQGYTWDLPNIMRGDVDTGERTFGNDYYQDLMLWSLPAALRGEDLAAPCRPEGLVGRLLAAAGQRGEKT